MENFNKLYLSQTKKGKKKRGRKRKKEEKKKKKKNKNGLKNKKDAYTRLV